MSRFESLDTKPSQLEGHSASQLEGRSAIHGSSVVYGALQQLEKSSS